MAETTTATFDLAAASRTRPAACSMRFAPKSELPPNLKAAMLARFLLTPPVQITQLCNAAGRSSAAGSSNMFSRFMACAPKFWSQLGPLERLWRGLEEETHRQVRFWRWVGNFSILLAVPPLARSAGNLHSRSRGSRLGRLSGNSLHGDGNHHVHTIPRLSPLNKASLSDGLLIGAFQWNFAAFGRGLTAQWVNNVAKPLQERRGEGRGPPVRFRRGLTIDSCKREPIRSQVESTSLFLQVDQAPGRRPFSFPTCRPRIASRCQSGSTSVKLLVPAAAKSAPTDSLPQWSSGCLSSSRPSFVDRLVR